MRLLSLCTRCRRGFQTAPARQWALLTPLEVEEGSSSMPLAGATGNDDCATIDDNVCSNSAHGDAFMQ
jgi:hypothetical protein